LVRPGAGTVWVAPRAEPPHPTWPRGLGRGWPESWPRMWPESWPRMWPVPSPERPVPLRMPSVPSPRRARTAWPMSWGGVARSSGSRTAPSPAERTPSQAERRPSAERTPSPMAWRAALPVPPRLPGAGSAPALACGRACARHGRRPSAGARGVASAFAPRAAASRRTWRAHRPRPVRPPCSGRPCSPWESPRPPISPCRISWSALLAFRTPLVSTRGTRAPRVPQRTAPKHSRAGPAVNPRLREGPVAAASAGSRPRTGAAWRRRCGLARPSSAAARRCPPGPRRGR
jgi:hypothetical protein